MAPSSEQVYIETQTTTPTKQCKKCGINRPLTDFYKSKYEKDGYSYRCNFCAKFYEQEWKKQGITRALQREKRQQEDSQQIRTCTKCHITQSFDNFHKHNKARLGIRRTCKSCDAAYSLAAPKKDIKADLSDPHATKLCRHCDIVKSVFEFYLDRRCKDGIRTTCKACSDASTKKWRNANKEEVNTTKRAWEKSHPEQFKEQRSRYYEKHREEILYSRRDESQDDPQEYKKARRDKFLKRRGTTEEWYQQQLAKQNYRCAICGTTDPKNNGERFAIDHDHRCCPLHKACDKCRRGLLCHVCNSRLGHLEKTEWVKKAIVYLRQYDTRNTDLSAQEYLCELLNAYIDYGKTVT